MQISKMKNFFTLLIFSILLFTSCKEKSYIYEVNEVNVSSNSSNITKTKAKRAEQFIAILYANLFAKPISPNQLVELSELIQSIGDKQVAFETIISKFLCDPEVQIPSNQEMRGDLSSFVIATYQRFYVRLPSQAEKAYFINFIESHPNLTPENIYFSFAVSDEYYHY